jgi:ABC-type sugar transport system ATPase subunit
MSLTVTDLFFAQPGGFTLEIPSLTFPAGKLTALLGDNGGGKTTLLRVLAGLERGASGSVRLDGAPVPKRAIAFAFQERVFLDGSVHHNLELALRLRGLGAQARAQRLAEAARDLGVEHLLNRDPTKLSGGEQQRVNLARALSLRAPLTLLDEPLASLDTQTRERLVVDLPATIGRFARVAIIVAHERREALAMTEHVVVLRGGRVVAQGPKAELLARPPDEQTARALGLLVLARGSERYAVADHDLKLEGGEGPQFELRVDRVTDFGTHAEVVGECCGASVTIRAGSGRPPPAGSLARVVAENARRLP